MVCEVVLKELYTATMGLAVLGMPALFAALVVFIIRRRRSPLSQQDDAERLLNQVPGSYAPTAYEEKAALAKQDWMPPNHFDGVPWLRRVLAEADESVEELHPVLKEFKRTIEDDPILFMLFTRMFTETPEATDPSGHSQVKDYLHMLKAFNVVISSGPLWAYTTAGDKGAIGAPITAILNWPMGTKAGREAFQNPKVNQQIKNTLNAWAQFLVTPASAKVLDDTVGWLSEQGLETMAEVATLHTHTKHPKRAFEHIFVCDESQENLGYKSWDDFFTRRFTPHMRPLPEAANNKPMIVSACESAPYRIATAKHSREKFWLKAQPYSLIDMLNSSAYYHRFIGGTVYQAYLSALSYHRWHAPISGTVLKIESIPGTYFAENYREPVDPEDPVGPLGAVLRHSQGYIAEVAARQIVYLQADDPRIGLMAMVFIGMVEVSSCESLVGEGEHVTIGQEIGMFHYGGSSYCMLFEKGVNVEFVPEAQNFAGGKNISVNSLLATVRE